MEDDEFELECQALEAIFSDSFERITERKIKLSVEPVTPEGEALSGKSRSSIVMKVSLFRLDVLSHCRSIFRVCFIFVFYSAALDFLAILKMYLCSWLSHWRIQCTVQKLKKS